MPFRLSVTVVGPRCSNKDLGPVNRVNRPYTTWERGNEGVVPKPSPELSGYHQDRSTILYIGTQWTSLRWRQRPQPRGIAVPAREVVVRTRRGHQHTRAAAEAALRRAHGGERLLFRKRPVDCVLQGREELRREPGACQAPEAGRATGSAVEIGRAHV